MVYAPDSISLVNETHLFVYRPAISARYSCYFSTIKTQTAGPGNLPCPAALDYASLVLAFQAFTEIFLCLILRLPMANKGIRPEPNNHAAAGTGTTAMLSALM